MHHSELSSRPTPRDSRADSPMREDIHLNSELPVNGNPPHGLPTPANDVPSSGFTAVNGESQRLRPDESIQRPMTMSNGDARKDGRSDYPVETGQNYSAPGHAGITKIGALLQDPHPQVPGPYQAHGWRPHGSHAFEQNGDRPPPGSPTTNKRKRDEATVGELRDDARDGRHYLERVESPKRQMTTLNSALSQPHALFIARDGVEPATAGTYVREPTPPMRRNHGEPPPLPRPEVESTLAASLKRSLHAEQQERQAQAAMGSPSPPDEDEDSLDHHQSQFYDQDGGQQGDADSKKRKRNFSNRTKTGCHTCRGRKKKCDEGKPTCLNCQRGSFKCGGYGAKPPGGIKLSADRQVVPLQAKQLYENPHGPPPPPGPNHYLHDAHYAHNGSSHPPPHYDSQRHGPYDPQHRYGHPGPIEHRPPSSREGWGPTRPAWPALEPVSQLSDCLPHADFSGVPPPPLMHTYPPHHRPHVDPWGAPPPPPGHYRQSTGPPTVISSGDSSATTTSSQRIAPMLNFLPSGQKTERSKMITGEPYKHFMDDELIRDRQSCRRAVESYNNACAASSTASPGERERYFQTIMDPTARTFNDGLATKWTGPMGTCGPRTMVETPFKCEFGYNIHLGEGVVISADCIMQDACRIYIGDRTVVGPGVKLYCVTTSIDATLRQGSQGNFVAGAIKVEDDVFIGANVIVMPYRTIGKGAVVGAGSVVTRDVKPYTVVAGNPAKVVRKRKIESGPDVDRHDDAIEEQNRAMMEEMRRGYPSAVKERMR